MIPATILKKKREGFELSNSEINFLINGIKSGEVSDVQITAFLTSSCINGLTDSEIASLTFAMRDSGKRFDFSKINKPKIDKHSTGGVGDKLSLLLVPLVVPLGLGVPMISGRGLGHTGGTVDKLESIDGFNIRPTDDTFYKLMEENFCFMACQTDDIAPADKKLYHIRDITGNVESTGLITASILSKKLVEDLDGLMLDMKVGNGAFMQDFDSARILAESMAKVAVKTGLKMRILFSSMEQPLGHSIGNWIEVEETIESLSGNYCSDIRIVTERLAAGMLLLGGIETELQTAIESVRKVWDDGTALNYFDMMIEQQNGNIEKSRNRYKNINSEIVVSDIDGIVTQIDTLYLGISGIMLGAGRKNVEDVLDYGAGIKLHRKLGDEVKKGDILATVFAKDKDKFPQAIDLIKNCIIISDGKNFKMPDLILDEWVI